MYQRSRTEAKAIAPETAHSPLRGLLIAAPIAGAFWALAVEAARILF